MEPIIESGMVFGPYRTNCCYPIEKSRVYTRIKPHVKIAELLWLRDDNASTCWIVEAKSSSPRFDATVPEGGSRCSEYLREIRDKLTNAFSLWTAIRLNRHGEEIVAELPSLFQHIELPRLDYRFVLVIKGHQKSWLQPLQDALRKELRPFIKTWAFSPNSVVVMNDKQAYSLGLISGCCTPPVS